MKLSQYYLPTLKEVPQDSEIISHQLMLRSGMIKKLSSGLYTWLPLGLKVLQKVEAIVRQELNKVGALEVLMPSVQPAELWQETSRWDEFGPLLLKIQDRANRDFCFGPTHEEVITDLVRNHLKSYKQTPLNLYQIQTKFRDEIRPRFGVMRAREFIMKDAYSFHTSADCLANTYQDMHQAYCNIFERMGLKFRPVDADTGSIGGRASTEFQVLAENGEDLIFYSSDSDYAANVEKATYQYPEPASPPELSSKTLLDTPNTKTIDDLVQQFNIPIEKTVKTLLVEGEHSPMVALVLRGDHTLNELKAEKINGIKAPLTMINEAQAIQKIGAGFGSLGPIDLNIPTIIDHSAAAVSGFCCGANQNDKHYTNCHWQLDAPLSELADLRNVQEGDPSPDGKGTLLSARGIEVGHIFQLGNKYSTAMKATVLDNQGKAFPLEMGCYGLGVSRVIAAAIEQNHDKDGIVWPEPLAPFQVSIVPMNLHKSDSVKEQTMAIYELLTAKGIDVLLDDRNERAGVMFADSDLIGIPHRLVIGEKSLARGVIEYKFRSASDKQEIALNDLASFIDGLNLAFP